MSRASVLPFGQKALRLFVGLITATLRPLITKGGERMEHDNPADCYNTVLKIGKKRALVDAVLTATAASDIFTQDLEDISANIAANSAAPAAGDPSPPKQPGSPKKAAARREVQEVDVAESEDWREVRVHFGKNRGLLLSELKPNQIHWYETEWMPKKENGDVISGDDLGLIEAIKAWRQERNAAKSAERNHAHNAQYEDDTQEMF